jgi:membrane associated rhomboid family serine protease
VIPLRDLEKRPGVPIVTALLVAVNVAVWVYVLTIIGERGAVRAFYDQWAFRAGPFFSGELTLAALVPLFTSEFLHGGWLHIGGNMLFLWVFGAAVEQRIGRVPYLAFYLLAGCVAALAQGLYFMGIGAGTVQLVGASGAISGVLGAYVVLSPTARVRTLVPLGLFMTPVTLPAVIVLGEWLVLQIISAFSLFSLLDQGANVAYFAHLGGFATGVVVGVAARLVSRDRRHIEMRELSPTPPS